MSGTNIEHMELSNEIKIKLQNLNKRRIKILFKNILLSYLFLLILFTSSFFIPIIESYSFPILFLGILFCLFINWVINSFDNSKKRYYDELKNTLIPFLIERHTTNFIYKPNKHINSKDYLKSGFSKKKFHRSKGHDLIIVTEGNYLFISSFFATYELTYRNHRGGTRQHTTAIFKGIFIVYQAKNPQQINIKQDFSPWHVKKKEDTLYMRYEYLDDFCEPSLFKSTVKLSTHKPAEKIINLIFTTLSKIQSTIN